MAQTRRIGHDHQAPFQVVVVGISSGDTRLKQTNTWPINLRPNVAFHGFLFWLGCGCSLTSQHFASPISPSLGDQSNLGNIGKVGK